MKGKKIVLALMVVLLIALICAGGAYAYFMTDLFKTPEQLLGKYLKDQFTQIAELDVAPFDEISERELKENSEAELTVSYSLPSEVASMLKEYVDGKKIDKVTFKATTDSDIENGKDYVNLNLKAGDLYMLNTGILLSDEELMFHLDDISDKAYVLKNEDLKAFAEKLGATKEILENIPDKIEIPTTQEDIEKKATAIKNLKDKYADEYINTITKGHVTVNKGVATKVVDQEVTAKQIVYDIDIKALGTATFDLYDKIIADPEFKVIVGDNFTDEQMDDLKEQLATAREDIEDYDQGDVKASLSLYVVGGKTVKTEILAINNESEKISFSMCTTEGSLVFVLDGDIGTDDEGNTVPATYVFKITNTHNGDENVLTFNMDIDEMNVVVAVTTVKVDANTYKATFDVKLTGEDVEEVNEALKPLKITLVETFGGKLKYEKLLKNGIVLNDMSKIELTTELMKCGTHLTSFMEENPASLVNIGVQAYKTFSSLGSSYSSSSFEDDDDDYYTSSSWSSFDDEEDDEDETSSSSLSISSLSTASSSSKALVKTDTEKALKSCINEYKNAVQFGDGNANIGDYLTLEKIQGIMTNYDVDLVDGNTLKVTDRDDNEYEVKMSIDSSTYDVTVTVE